MATLDNMATDDRRDYGTGSVYQRSDGRWLGTVEAGWTARGTRRRITVSAATEAAAKTKLRDRQRQIAREGVPEASANASETVKTYAERWLVARQDKVRSKSWSTDASMIRRHIIPSIGNRKMSALDVSAVHKVEKDAAALADSSLVRLRATLDKMLRDAQQEGHPIPERVLNVPRSGAGESDRTAMPDADLRDVVAVLNGRPDKSRWLMALLYGERQAECLGLTWDRVDFEAGTIDTTWQLQAVRYKHGCGKVPCGRRFGGDCPQRELHRKRGDVVVPLDGALSLVDPKTKAGRRVQPLLPSMEEALRQWRTEAPASPHGLVWPRSDGRPALAKDDDAAWRGILDAAQVARVGVDLAPPRGIRLDARGPRLIGRRYTIHEARHAVATMLKRTGASDTTAAAILGQSKMLARYVHTTTADKAIALDPVAALLGL